MFYQSIGILVVLILITLACVVGKKEMKDLIISYAGGLFVIFLVSGIAILIAVKLSPVAGLIIFIIAALYVVDRMIHG